MLSNIYKYHSYCFKIEHECKKNNLDSCVILNTRQYKIHSQFYEDIYNINVRNYDRILSSLVATIKLNSNKYIYNLLVSQAIELVNKSTQTVNCAHEFWRIRGSFCDDYIKIPNEVSIYLEKICLIIFKMKSVIKMMNSVNTLFEQSLRVCIDSCLENEIFLVNSVGNIPRHISVLLCRQLRKNIEYISICKFGLVSDISQCIYIDKNTILSNILKYKVKNSII